jgi:hypothetical protein
MHHPRDDEGGIPRGIHRRGYALFFKQRAEEIAPGAKNRPGKKSLAEIKKARRRGRG